MGRFPLPFVHDPDETSALLARSFRLMVLGTYVPVPELGGHGRAGVIGRVAMDLHTADPREGEPDVGERPGRGRCDSAADVVHVDPVTDLERARTHATM